MKDDERFVKAFFEHTNSPENTSYALISLLRFRNKLSGTRLLRTALMHSLTHIDEQLTVTEVYAAVAEQHNVTAACVERAIRNTIHDCYNHGSLRLLNDIFACSLINDKYPPTNAEFITDVTSYLHFLLMQNSKISA